MTTKAGTTCNQSPPSIDTLRSNHGTLCSRNANASTTRVIVTFPPSSSCAPLDNKGVNNNDARPSSMHGIRCYSASRHCDRSGYALRAALPPQQPQPLLRSKAPASLAGPFTLRPAFTSPSISSLYSSYSSSLRMQSHSQSRLHLIPIEARTWRTRRC